MGSSGDLRLQYFISPATKRCLQKGKGEEKSGD